MNCNEPNELMRNFAGYWIFRLSKQIHKKANGTIIRKVKINK